MFNCHRLVTTPAYNRRQQPINLQFTSAPQFLPKYNQRSVRNLLQTSDERPESRSKFIDQLSERASKQQPKRIQQVPELTNLLQLEQKRLLQLSNNSIDGLVSRTERTELEFKNAKRNAIIGGKQKIIEQMEAGKLDKDRYHLEIKRDIRHELFMRSNQEFLKMMFK
ncbi:Hypothetical_protein [Hexamita inflata]|uniref:Hypothetical_protein n=1 Tax=Hexamita inflata TaxID=28002 RepID=A0AA86NS77_9EUKA|nr:Hypothetical protein HINF_LOCUS11904 [Hexamita inflata]